MKAPTQANCVEFLKRLVQTESLPGHEGAIAQVMSKELEELGFADIHIDEVGNVLARAPGAGRAPGLFFNTHLDHVDVGDQTRWPHPPFAAHFEGDILFGRGTVDIKGPLAAQVYGAAALLKAPAAGDVWVTAVVQEEIGGVGARHLAPRLKALSGGASDQPPIVIVGEPSSNQVRRGHRGRIELMISFFGRSAHASVPHRARNPLYPYGRFMNLLGRLPLDDHDELGPSTLAPTLLETDQTSANVIPAEVHQTIDIRTVPGQDAEQARAGLLELATLACNSVEEHDRCTCQVEIPTYPRQTYTGLSRPIPASNPTYLLPSEHPAVQEAVRIVVEHGGPSGSEPWNFATDGGHFAASGAVPIGFAPGDETLAHTLDERIDLRELEQAVSINQSLARALCETA